MNTLLNKIKTTPEQIQFSDVIEVIEKNYTFTPTKFRNGETINNAGDNNGSCKIFAFAQLHNLTQEQTLHCFGEYYRVDVLQHPEGTDHANIRNFIKFGWDGIEFDSESTALA